MKGTRFLNKFFIPFLVFTALFISSCSNVSDPLQPLPFFSADKYTSISGEIILPQNGAFPDSIAACLGYTAEADGRSAFPSALPSGEKTFTVVATASGETDVNGAGYSDVTSSYYYVNNIKIGVEWTVTVTMNIAGSPVMSGSTTITPTETAQQSTVNVTVTPVQTAGGSGSIKLTMSFDSTANNKINYFSVTLANGTESTNWTNAYNATTYEEGKVISKSMIQFSHLPSGSYTIAMNFYNSDNVLLFSDIQVINIFDNLLTNTWVSNGGTSPINSSNQYKVTADHLAAFTLKQIYVGETPYSASPSDTNGTGSIYAPLATVSRAVKTVNAMPKKDASDNPIEYTIHVKNGITENVSETINFSNNTTIECWKISVGDKAGVAELIWTSTETTNTSMFSIGSGTKLIIEGVKSWIGPGETNPNWSGLVLNGNKANDKIGYGINACSGELHFNGGVIKNFKTASDGSYSAAIYFSYNDKGNVYINGGIIENNESSYGAISIDSPQSYKHEMIMNDGIIRNNSSTNSQGGGVHVSRGTFRMRGGEISGNTAPSGGGVGVTSDSSDSCYVLFDMSGGKISGNSATSYGGGIYVYTSSIGAYIYGNAIIGDENASEPATAEEGHHSNIAPNGGGICGTCHIGYKPGGTVNADGYIPKSGITPVKDETSAVKIYYNYSTAVSSDTVNYGGGGVCNSKKISNVTFAYNGAAYEGGAISSGGEIRDCTFIENEAANFGGAIAVINNITFIGTIDSAYGGAKGKNDIYVRNSGWGYTDLKITIGGPITSSAGKKPHVVSGDYSDDKLFIKLADTLESTTTITAACSSFILESDGQKVWEVEPNETSGEGLLKSRFGTKKASEAKDKYDIVFKDGSATPYSTTMNLSTVQQNAAIAIIFYKGTELNNDGDNSTVRTLGVGLINENTNSYSYCKNSVTGYIRSFDSTIYDEIMGTGYKNGLDNYEKVCTALSLTTLPDSNNEYFVLTYGYAYKTKASGLGLSSNTISEYQTGWYAPSALELYYLCMECKNTSESLNTKIAACRTNATVFNMTKQYFSSSQSKDESSKVLAVDFASGEFVHKIKNHTSCACAIHEF